MQQKHLSQLTKELLQELGINEIGDIMTILQISKKQRPQATTVHRKSLKKKSYHHCPGWISRRGKYTRIIHAKRRTAILFQILQVVRLSLTKLLRPREVEFTNFSMDGCSKDLKTVMSMSLQLEFGGWPSKKMLGGFVCCADSMIHVRKETRTTRGTPNHVLE